MVKKFITYDHAMQNHARKINPCIFCVNIDFLIQKE